jgi:manganese efflux pump family protein
MSFLELLLLGIGLSMDAFAVSITDGMTFNKVNVRRALAVSLVFGIFQAVMPVIGYFGGRLFYEQIKSIDHWIALILLGFLGGKMIAAAVCEYREKRITAAAIKKDGIPRSCKCRQNLTARLLFVQGVATSIDALAVGISLAAVNANITLSAAIIGVTTTVICFPAVYIGKKTGDLLNDKAEFAGGCILIGIGLKIFIEHMFFS